MNDHSSSKKSDVNSQQTSPRNSYTTDRTYPVYMTIEDSNDFIVEVKASLLKRIRKKLEPLKVSKFQWPELLLCITSIAFGVTSSGFITVMTLPKDNTMRIMLINVSIFSLLIFGVTMTAYLFYRHYNNFILSDVVTELIDEIPDPDETIEKGQNQNIQTLNELSKGLNSDDGGAKL